MRRKTLRIFVRGEVVITLSLYHLIPFDTRAFQNSIFQRCRIKLNGNEQKRAENTYINYT